MRSSKERERGWGEGVGGREWLWDIVTTDHTNLDLDAHN